MRDTLANDIKIAESAFDALRRNIVESFTPAMREGTQSITTMIEGLRLLTSGAAEGAGGILGFLAGIGKGLKQLDDFGKALFQFDPLFNIIKQLARETGDEIRDLAQEQAFNELLKQSASSIDLFNRSIKSMDMQKLVDEYKELNKVVEKTEEQTKRQAQLENELRAVYGASAIAIDKVTGEYFLNTEAIERNIKATSDETKTTVASIETRLKAIDQQLFLNKQVLDSTKITAGFTQSILLENIQVELSNDLLKEKELLLKTLSTEFGYFADDSVNGWSVFKEGAKGAKDALAELEKQRKEEEKARREAEKARADADAARRKEEQNALKRIKLESDLQVELLDSAIIARESMKKIMEAEGERAKALLESSEIYDLQKQKIEVLYDTELANIQVSIDSNENKRKRELIAYEKYYQALIQLDTQWRLEQIKSNELTLKDAEKSQKKEFDLNMEKLENDPQIKLYEKRRKEREKEAKEEAVLENQRAMLLNQSIGAARRAFDTFFEYRQARRQEEIDQITRWEEERIKLAGDNAEAINAIREEADAKRRAIMNKNARDERAMAMFNIALNTAQAIVAALKLTIGGIPLSIAIGAIGAAQLALVAAKPLPQFAKGTDNAPEGHAIVGEKGRELIWDKQSGQVTLSPDKPTVQYLSKGSKVIPNKETERILGTKIDRNSIADERSGLVLNSKKESTDLLKLGGMFKAAVKDIPLHQTTFDANGVREFVKKGNNRTERLNRRYKY